MSLKGQHSKFNPERCAAIVDDISNYVPYEFAAEANGISPATLYNWINEGEADRDNGLDTPHSAFLEAIKRAERDKIKVNAATIHNREDVWQAKGWLLERRHWKHFSNNAPLVELNKRLDELEAKKDKDNG